MRRARRSPGSAAPLRLALVGFGHVGRAFARLLLQKEDALHDKHGLAVAVTAILTRAHGWAVDARGLDLARALATDHSPGGGAPPAIAALPADVLVEVTTLEPRTGQPALDHVRAALEAGMHVITANKGPIAHAYRELAALAAARGRALRFEATLADDLPVFNLVRHALPTAEIRSLRGIVNSTTNHLLSAAARGERFADALAEAQRLGIAERDPSSDLEGYDAAAKATILANVLLGASLHIEDVVREPITEDVAHQAAMAARAGLRVRPLVFVDRDGASFRPMALQPHDPLYAVDGFSMALEIDTDVAGRLVVSLHDPRVEQTAFALLADLVSLPAR